MKTMTKSEVLDVLDDARVTTGNAVWRARIAEARAAVSEVYEELAKFRAEVERLKRAVEVKDANMLRVQKCISGDPIQHVWLNYPEQPCIGPYQILQDAIAYTGEPT